MSPLETFLTVTHQNLNQVKRRQWRVAFYTISLQAGIAGLMLGFPNLVGQAILSWLLPIASSLLACAALYLLTGLQHAQRKFRIREAMLVRDLSLERYAELEPAKVCDFWAHGSIYLLLVCVPWFVAFFTGLLAGESAGFILARNSLLLGTVLMCIALSSKTRTPVGGLGQFCREDSGKEKVG